MDPSDAPPGWNEAALGQFANTMWHNTHASFYNYRKFSATLVEIDDIFNATITGIVDPKHPLATLLAMRCAASLKVACLLSMSAPIEAYAVMRAALETAGYSHIMITEPGAEEIWLRRDESKKSADAVRSMFSSGAIRRSLAKEDLNLSSNFVYLYDNTIKLGAHPNEKSLSQSLHTEEDRERRQHHFKVIMLPEGGITVQAAMRMCALTGITILRIYEAVFPDQFGPIKERLVEVRKGLADTE